MYFHAAASTSHVAAANGARTSTKATTETAVAASTSRAERRSSRFQIACSVAAPSARSSASIGCGHTDRVCATRTRGRSRGSCSAGEYIDETVPALPSRSSVLTRTLSFARAVVRAARRRRVARRRWRACRSAAPRFDPVTTAFVGVNGRAKQYTPEAGCVMFASAMFFVWPETVVPGRGDRGERDGGPGRALRAGCAGQTRARRGDPFCP